METNIDINVKHRFTKTVGRQAADILIRLARKIRTDWQSQ